MKGQEVMDYAMERICYYLNKRTKGKMKIDCVMYANEFGELAKSKGVSEWFSFLLEQETGAADLITVRGMRLLKQADVIIYAGSLVNPELLQYAKVDCRDL